MNLAGTPHPIWDSRRLWSLAEMINFYLYNFVFSQERLKTALSISANGARNAPNSEVPPAENDHMSNAVEFVAKYCVDALALPEASNTIKEIYNILNNHHAQPYMWQKLHSLLETLDRQISIQLRAECFFHYLREDARMIMSLPKDWAAITNSFPSIENEIRAGVDCFAIGHNTACIFHMMRVAEHGLRMVARERGIKTIKRATPIEWSTWREVFQAIEGKLKGVRGAPAGPKRETALKFYESALSDQHALQTHYRDPTMHFRDSYDRGQAHSAIFRVNSLMANLATKLREDRIRKIRWGL
jgi:hypothetical protein